MPANELVVVKELREDIMSLGIPQPQLVEGMDANRKIYEKICSKARDTWAFAICTNASEAALTRYFSYHMRLISSLLTDRHRETTDAYQELAGLAVHLYNFYGQFVDKDLVAPSKLLARKTSELVDQMLAFRDLIVEKVNDPALLDLLTKVFSGSPESFMNQARTFGSLLYLEKFIPEVTAVLINNEIPHADLRLSEKLLETNFNHIRFFLYMEDKIRESLANLANPEKLHLLRNKLTEYQPFAEHGMASYSDNWPSIGKMLCKWLKEEIAQVEMLMDTEKEISVPRLNRLGLDLSVAHIACLIKAFYQAKVYETKNLTEIFTFHANHFGSKKREKMAPKYLSREYYSITQKTAAVVIDLLNQMIKILKKEFFLAFIICGTWNYYIFQV